MVSSAETEASAVRVLISIHGPSQRNSRKADCEEEPRPVLVTTLSLTTSNNRRHNLAYAALQVAVVRNRRADGNVGGRNCGDTAGDHLRRVNQEPRRDALFQPVPAQVSNLL